MADNKLFWQDKIALITGGSSGIGLAIAQYLSSRGAHVWLLARHEDRLHSALESLNYESDQICGSISTDVSKWDQVAAAVKQIESKVGVPDLVINSAGVAHPGYFQELGVEIFQWMTEVNYYGTVYVCKAVVPGMVARGNGHIVNISSGAGFIGRFGYTAYGATKFAIRGFSDVLRAELKPLGVKVSIAFPPDVDTPQLEYELEYQPLETKAISGVTNLISPNWEGSSTLLSPEQAARTIMHQVERGSYFILPGFEMKLLFWLSSFVGTGIYPIMDWMVARAQRNLQGGG